MEDIFEFVFHGNIYFGNGSRNSLKQIVKENHYNRLCIVVDEGLTKVEMVRELIDSLEVDLVHEVICDISEPTYHKLEEKRLGDEYQIDAFVGIGGGSALDLSKALSVLYSNRNEALSYRGFDQFKNPIAPIIALPTTAGTGSEITPNASFIDSDSKKKMGINGEAIRPKYSILDPQLTLSCPLNPTISAAVDSMVHATEAFIARKTNPLAKMFAIEGFSRVYGALPNLVSSLDDLALRTTVMYGSFLSAIALMNSGTGPAAALSYPLGVHFSVPHGLGGAIFLPEVMEHNISQGVYDYPELLKDNRNTKKSANEFLSSLRRLWLELQIPSNLSSFGITTQHIPLIINDTMELGAALEQNPIEFGSTEIKNMLARMLA